MQSEFIKNSNEERKEVNLTFLDITCKKMVIDSAWIYKERLGEKTLESAIKELAKIYPELTGALAENKIIYPQNGILYSYEDENKTVEYGYRGYQIKRRYQAKFDKKKYIYSVKLTNFRDGAILSIKASHAFMDGYAFYRTASDLASLYRGESINKVLSFSDRFSSLPIPEEADKSLFFQLTDDDKSAFFKSFLKRKKISVIHLEKEFILSLSSSLGCSKTTAILTHLYDLRGRKKLGFVITVNHRKFISTIGSDYAQNASTTIYPIELEPDLSLKEAASKISNALRLRLSRDESYFSSYLKILEAKSLETLPFPLSRAYGKDSDLLIINSFLPYDLYDSMRAENVPFLAFPPTLKDPLRLFPLKDGSVDIIMRK